MIALVGGEKLQQARPRRHRCSRSSSRRSSRRRAAGRADQQVPRPVQPADLARRHEGRLRVLQRQLRHQSPAATTTVPPCFAYKQSQQGALISDTAGYTGFEKYGTADRLDLPRRGLNNSTLVRSEPGREAQRRRRLHDDRRRARATVGSTTATSGPRRGRDRPYEGPGAPSSASPLQRRAPARLSHQPGNPFTVPPFTNTTHRPSPPTSASNSKGTSKYLATSLAPSGKALAYSTNDGIYSHADRRATAHPPCSGARRLWSPDWGPAGVRTQERSRPATSTTTPGPAKSSRATLKLAKRKHGLTATLTEPARPARRPSRRRSRAARRPSRSRGRQEFRQGAFNPAQERHRHRQVADRVSASLTLTISAPVTDPQRLRKRSPSVSR